MPKAIANKVVRRDKGDVLMIVGVKDDGRHVGKELDEINRRSEGVPAEPCPKSIKTPKSLLTAILNQFRGTGI